MGREQPLPSLIERVEKATGPDRELDALILSALLSKEPIVAVEQSRINGVWCAYTEDYNGKRRLWERPAPFRQMEGLTESVDAALALIERVLPGWSVHVSVYPDGKGSADAQPPNYTLSPFDSGPGLRPSPALALVLSMLRALEASNG